MTIDSTKIVHLLRRTEYVARPERVAALSKLATLDLAIDDILSVTASVPIPAYSELGDCVNWWIDQMIDSPKPIQEKMTFFWHGHFTSAGDKVGYTDTMLNQNKLFRDNCLGDFHQLAQLVAKDPAMLGYLDNQDNHEASPNQNFGRELLELFLLGIGNYAEDDVEAAAAAWTGHGVNWNYGTPGFRQYRFDPSVHDSSRKTFLGRQANYDGPDIIDEVLIRNTSARQLAARRMVGKLWDYFAYPGAPASVLDSLQSGFASDWSIKGLLKQMFQLDEFYTPTAVSGLLRSPVEWVVALLYHAGYRSNTTDPEKYLNGMGQLPFYPPNVAGWRNNSYWISTGTIGSRGDFVESFAWRMQPAFSRLYSLSVSDAVDDLASSFGMSAPALPLSATSRSALVGYLTAQRAAEHQSSSEVIEALTLMMLTPEMSMA